MFYLNILFDVLVKTGYIERQNPEYKRARWIVLKTKEDYCKYHQVADCEIKQTHSGQVINGDGYYEEIMELSYEQLVQHLLNKHGPAKQDYFTDCSCTIKNKNVTRTEEGLFCHHIDEDKAVLLSNPELACQNSFEYQRANRLVYCDFLEHFLLHILIAEEPKREDANEWEVQGVGGAVCFICKQLNDLYNGYKYKEQWLINTTSKVKNNYLSYIKMLKRLWNLIKKDAMLSMLIKKEDLAKGLNGTVHDNILSELDN